MQAPVVVMSKAQLSAHLKESNTESMYRHSGGRQAGGAKGTVIKYHSCKDVSSGTSKEFGRD